MVISELDNFWQFMWDNRLEAFLAHPIIYTICGLGLLTCALIVIAKIYCRIKLGRNWLDILEFRTYANMRIRDHRITAGRELVATIVRLKAEKKKRLEEEAGLISAEDATSLSDGKFSVEDWMNRLTPERPLWRIQSLTGLIYVHYRNPMTLSQWANYVDTH